MEKTNFFEHFRRQRTFETKSLSNPKIYFQINFDVYGAFLEVVDSKGKPVEANYLAYSGSARNLLRAIEQIKEKNSFVIDWEKSSGRIYLAEYNFLVSILERTGLAVNQAMKPLSFKKDTGHIRLIISEEEQEEGLLEQKPMKTSEPVLVLGEEILDDFDLLNEETAITKDSIISIKPLGSAFQNINFFETELADKDLPVFFSILFTYLENVEIRYLDFEVEIREEKVFAHPALIFEKVDVDDALYMRVGQVLPNMTVDVLDKFDLYRFVEINELERKLVVKFVEQESMDSLIATIKKLLKKHSPKGKKGERAEAILEEDLFIIPSEVASNFIYNELANLLLTYQVFGAEKLKSYKVTATQPSVSLNLSHGIDFLEGDVSLDFGSEKINLFDALAQLRKNNYVKLSNGTHALVNDGYLKKLERIFRKKTKKKAEISFFDLPLVEELIEEKISGAAFKKSRAIFEGFNTIKDKRFTKPKVNATLRPYQKDGCKWLQYLQENKLGGCLADDMGLGKTLQTIALLSRHYPKTKKASLIVMPRSLLFNWSAEMEKFAPQLKHHTYYGPNRDFAKTKGAHLIFTTYATMRNDIELLKEEKFFYVILDESQNIKNIQAQTTKAVMLLNAEHRLALSGTPIENNLGELYSLFRFLNPSMFGTLKHFSQNYIVPIQKNNDKAAILQLRKKIYPFILRRLKREVLKELPDKIEQVLYVEMSDKQKKFYEERRQFYQAVVQNQIDLKGVGGSRFVIFQALSELRQIATVPESLSEGRILSPKRELLQEQLFDTIANGHKVLIFVNFLAALELIGQQLEEMGVDFVSMSGATRDRQSLVTKFQNDPRCRVFLMTLKTGGTGLNLTAADTIFIFDPWWNIAAENQAIDRAHRIGQQNKVLAYKLITKDTIEEKILQLQEAKRELFDNVISSDGQSMKSLTEEDIKFIFG